MHCANCGKKLDNDSIFCDNCGYKISEEDLNTSMTNSQTTSQKTNAIKNINYNSLLSDLLKIIKNPLKSMNNSSILHNKNLNLILTAIFLIITPLIVVLGLRTIISDLIKGTMSLGMGLYGFNQSALTEVNTQVSFLLNEMLPILNTTLIGILILCFSLVLPIWSLHFVYRYILKRDISIEIPIKMTFISLFLYSILIIFSILLSKLSLNISIIIIVFSSILNLAFIFLSFYNTVDNDENSFYAIPVTYVVSILIGNYITYKIIFNTILSAITKMGNIPF